MALIVGCERLPHEKRNITPQEYILRHPGGALGQLRENEK